METPPIRIACSIDPWLSAGSKPLPIWSRWKLQSDLFRNDFSPEPNFQGL